MDMWWKKQYPQEEELQEDQERDDVKCMHIEMEDLHPSIYKMCIDRAAYTVSSRMPPEIYFGQGKTHCSSCIGFKEEHGRSYSCYILPVTFPVRIDKTLIHTLFAIIARGSVQDVLTSDARYSLSLLEQGRKDC